jgi:SAM-dependent methyltransferase
VQPADSGEPAGMSVPNGPRVKDYFLGGKDNYAADRAKAEDLEAAAQAHSRTSIREMVRLNRAFTLKAVTWSASMLGIGQFLDLGCGLPSRPSVHEAARDGYPDARVVYVDSDPLVMVHVAALQNGPGLAAVQADDLADPVPVLREVRELLDFTEPACIVLGGVLSGMDSGAARKAVAGYADVLAPGSAMVISCAVYGDPEFGERMADLFGGDGRWFNHTKDDIASFFSAGELRLVHGRVMDLRCWPTCPVTAQDEPGGMVLGGIGLVD